VQGTEPTLPSPHKHLNAFCTTLGDSESKILWSVLTSAIHQKMCQPQNAVSQH